MFGKRNYQEAGNGGLYHVGRTRLDIPVKSYMVDMGVGKHPIVIVGTPGIVEEMLTEHKLAKRRITLIDDNGNGNGHNSNGNGKHG